MRKCMSTVTGVKSARLKTRVVIVVTIVIVTSVKTQCESKIVIARYVISGVASVET